MLFFYYNFSTLTEENNTEEIYDEFSNIDKLHWTHMPITYQINNKGLCGDFQLNETIRAFQEIEKATESYVNFLEVESEADLDISCLSLVDIKKDFEKSIKCKNITFNYKKEKIDVYNEGILSLTQYSVSTETIKRTENETIYQVCYSDNRYVSEDFLGEARPSIINNKIIHGEIYLYKGKFGWTKCSNFPTKSVHEIFHVLGFVHFTSSNIICNPICINLPQEDIMYPYISCDFQNKINLRYITCLKNIYSNNEVDGTCSEINFWKLCPEGYVLGQNYKCYEECGEGHYCSEDSTCIEKECFSCSEGYYLSDDNLCYPEEFLGSFKALFNPSSKPPTLLSVNSKKQSV